jgi:CRP-like cAMP-binding protein
MSKALLKKLPLLEKLSEEQFNILHPLVEKVDCQAEEMIFTQGEEAQYLYLVVKGTVAIRFNPDDGETLTVARVREGEVFGWSSALGSHTYTSGAVCLENGELLRIEGNALKQLCEEYPETGILILDRLASVIAQRLQGTRDQVVAMLHHGLRNTQTTENMGG